VRPKTWLIVILVALSLLVSVYEGVLYWHDIEPNEGLLSLYGLIFVLVLILWVDADSKDYPTIYRPFEYGYLAFIFWLPYLPYYLWRTRKAVGLLMLLGFAGLFLMGFLTQLVIYAAR